MADPDNVSAEFGIIIRSTLKGTGLGRLLLEKLIAYQRASGTRQLVATVLRENQRMLELAYSLGFRDAPLQPEDETRDIVLELQPATDW